MGTAQLIFCIFTKSRFSRDAAHLETGELLSTASSYILFQTCANFKTNYKSTGTVRKQNQTHDMHFANYLMELRTGT